MSELAIRDVCVIGAGTMGAAIAAHLANLGFGVTLLDATTELAAGGLDRARQVRPSSFYIPDRSLSIRLGNTTENLDLVAECDWVCEAIVERLDAKRSLLAAIETRLRPDAMISTNTSGLQIALLAEGRSGEFRRRFLGTHFFNPPRYLKLLELIPTPDTDPRVVRKMTQFLEDCVARRVILAKDTPGFIANRFGLWSMFRATHTAERLHLDVETVDLITGAFLGRPRSGTFRLNDLIGLDVMRDIALNLQERSPDDPQTGNLSLPKSLFTLLSRGWIGEKAGQGYYRREGKELLFLDLQTFAYRQLRDIKLTSVDQLGTLPLPERLRRAIDLRDEAGEFLREYLIPTLSYANAIKAEVSHSIYEFDRVMEWGFGWEMGPFAMIDAIGPERLGLAPEKFYRLGEQRSFEGPFVKIPRDARFAQITDFPVIESGETFHLRDLDDGVTAVCLTTKMGVIGPRVIKELTELLEGKLLHRFVLTGEAKSFSAGFDLTFFRDALAAERLSEIHAQLLALQTLGELLETRDCVAAVYGHCLGAGLELALSCSTILAGAETKIGLPESRVGLIPGGRGVALVRLHNQFSAKRLCEIAITLAEGTIAENPDVARALGYLRTTDKTIYHADTLISMAKKEALEASPRPRPLWEQTVGPLVGMIDRELAGLRASGTFTAHDELIGNKLKMIVAKETDYEDALARERTEFVDLCTKALTHARIKHMLENNRPLRN